MSNPLPVYSQDIWDYLSDMPYMPNRNDRDKLVAIARDNPQMQRQVAIWDYFFRIQPADLGKPQRREIAELEKLLADETQQAVTISTRKQAEIQSLHAQIEQLPAEQAASISQIQQDIQKKLENSAQRNRTFGIIAAVLGVPVLLLALWWIVPALLYHNSAFVSMFCCLPVGGLFSVAGLFLLIRSTVRPEERDRLIQEKAAEVQKQIITRQSEMEETIRIHQQQIASLQETLDQRSIQITERIQALNTEIAPLIEQIPSPPSNDQIAQWMQEDIEMLKERAIEETGMQDGLIDVLDAENPFVIRGPAELQERKQIPRPYISQDSDNNKHLHARRFVIMPDRKFADFYGVYNIEFILLTKDILATYGVFYDFINGREIENRTGRQFYGDVSLVETRKGFREVEVAKQKMIMDNVPSLRISLDNGQSIDVTFPDEGYFEQISSPYTRAMVWLNDPRVAAGNAIRAINSFVRDAKQLRQFRSLS